MSNQTAESIQNSFSGKDILSLSQFDKPSIQTVFQRTAEIKKQFQSHSFTNTLQNTLSALLFFEPSSRTFSSFAAAIKRQGGQTLEFQNPGQTSSTVKGETLEDTARVMENYAECIIMRHPDVGSVDRVARAVDVPVLNAGDGAGEHPTQALMDLFTIQEKTGTLNGITGVFAGDLLYGRTVHSLLKGFSLYEQVTIYLLAPDRLQVEQSMIEELTSKGMTVHTIASTEDIPSDCVFWYWTRVQKERFEDQNEYEQLKHAYILTQELVTKRAGTDTLLMHPLPRVGEIAIEVDNDPRALYLNTQIKNGMYTRMALLNLILNR